MKKHILCLLLAFLLTTPTLLSCGGSSDETTPTSQDTTTAVTETETETERLYPKYEANYNGADFNILYYDAVEACGWGNTIPCDIAVEELTGDALSDAIYNRNFTVAEMYNIKFGTKSTTNSGNMDEIRQQVTAGTDDYDAAFPGWYSLYSMISGGYLTDMEPLFDFSMPWYDSKARNAFSVLGKSYATISDLTYMDKMLSIVILFNKDIALDYDLGDLYQTVLDGDWTFDLMKTLCETVATDVDGDGKMTTADRFGVISQNDAVYQLYQSAGQQYCRMNSEGIPELSVNNEEAVSVFQTVYDFMNDKNMFFNRMDMGVDTIGVCNMFANNQALFIMRQIQCAFELRNMEADFGIIPTPKVLPDQEDYYTSIGYTVTFCETIPAVVKDLDMTVTVLDTLAAESYYSVNEALYDKILGGKIVRDETSRKNLDIILDNRVYDPGCVYNFGSITNTMMDGFKKGSNQVASLIAGVESKVTKAIDEFVEVLTDEE